MILKERKIEEYHPNGQLMYETTMCTIDPTYSKQYSNIIRNTKGELLIRTGITRAFFNNGQLHWEKEYDNDGSIKNHQTRRYRRDGSIIID